MDDKWQVPMFIRDGYTRQGHIAGVVGLHRPLTFSFRPMTTSERTVVINKVGTLDADKQDAEMAKTLAEHVIDWDAGDDVTPDNILALPPELNKQLSNIVCGFAAPESNGTHYTAEQLVEQEGQEVKN